MASRLTTKDLLTKIEQHERECGIRLDHITKRLDSGSNKFKFQQNTIWGLYAFIFAVAVIDKLV